MSDPSPARKVADASPSAAPSGAPSPTTAPAKPQSAGGIVRLAADRDGRDPLVQAFLQQHRALCAYHTVSWWWLLVGAVCALAGAVIGAYFAGPSASPPWTNSQLVLRLNSLFGNPKGVLAGIGVAAIAASALGVVLNLPRRGMRVPGFAMLAIGLGAAAAQLVVPDAAARIAGIVSPAFGFSWQLRMGWLGAELSLAAIGLALVVSRARVPAGQEPLFAALLIAACYLLFYDRLVFGSVVTGALCAIYVLAIAFRLLALAIGLRRAIRFDAMPEPVGGWPIYTVLVPLYKERGVAGNILASLAKLDYPRDKLDVKFLLEADDTETLPALQAAGIPPWAEVVVVPAGQPKTKPRACNHGLARARGEYLVIFDAEDRPETDQLKQAVLAFADLPPRAICLQAQLAYHNHDQNLLTRWFALEYNVWFRRYLAGLQRLGVPIPLGGTSNHFRTAQLKELGGWDPFNVTEDCDLGVRLYVAGYQTRLIDSITWEEANSRVGNWLRQRSRWLKGYLVTHLVWFRWPLRTLWKLGPWGALGFVLSVFSVAALAAVNLVLWALTGIYVALIGVDLAHGRSTLWELLATRDRGHDRWSWPMVYHGHGEDHAWSVLSQVFFVASLCLLVGNLAFIVVNAVAGRRRGQPGLGFAALLSPLYWVLISLAAWKGIWQLLTRPHYWEKTVHGLDHPPGGSAKG